MHNIISVFYVIQQNKSMKKTKEEILEKLKDSIMIEKIVNEDIKNHQAV